MKMASNMKTTPSMKKTSNIKTTIKYYDNLKFEDDFKYERWNRVLTPNPSMNIPSLIFHFLTPPWVPYCFRLIWISNSSEIKLYCGCSPQGKERAASHTWRIQTAGIGGILQCDEGGRTGWIVSQYHKTRNEKSRKNLSGCSVMNDTQVSVVLPVSDDPKL